MITQWSWAGAVPAGAVGCYMNGELVVTVRSLKGARCVFEVPLGRHLLTVLYAGDGAADGTACSRDEVYVRVRGPCDTALGGEECDTVSPCGNASCKVVTTKSTEGLCSYGPTWCCAFDMECAWGEYCVDGACVDCLVDEDCPAEALGCFGEVTCSDGACVTPDDLECCVKDADCVDELPCTTDTCDGVSGTCQHVQHDPDCCNDSSDCKLTDPCIETFCDVSGVLGRPFCRWGPKKPGCCEDDSMCDDGHSCTLDECELEPNEAFGQCTYPPDPAKTACCETDDDCAHPSLDYYWCEDPTPVVSYKQCKGL